jgi:hypothetical protein
MPYKEACPIFHLRNHDPFPLWTIVFDLRACGDALDGL